MPGGYGTGRDRDEHESAGRDRSRRDVGRGVRDEEGANPRKKRKKKHGRERSTRTGRGPRARREEGTWGEEYGTKKANPRTGREDAREIPRRKEYRGTVFLPYFTLKKMDDLLRRAF
jgi:hypothetical protein